MRFATLATLMLVSGTLLVSASPAAGLFGSAHGARVQVVVKEVRPVDVVTVNCLGPCPLIWESDGPSRLTLTCLDYGETIVWDFPPPPDRPHLSHPCIVRSTLEIGGATESVVFWRANACNVEGCEPWP